MVSRHFDTDKEIVLVEGHHRSHQHQNVSPVPPTHHKLPRRAKTTSPKHFTLPQGVRPENAFPSSQNTPLKWGGGGYHHNALRPRTVFTPNHKPFSRALADTRDDPDHYFASTSRGGYNLDGGSPHEWMVLSRTPDAHGNSTPGGAQPSGGTSYEHGVDSQYSASQSPQRWEALPTRDGARVGEHGREFADREALLGGLVAVSKPMTSRGERTGNLAQITPTFTTRGWTSRSQGGHL